ncbi:FR47-like protein [Seminavis robusta]|uniref:FR47-like protein n=1 Tax=Seminavis robusta TaxID=568900 RepID=A0A9N8DP73_9STRA|nr:FR47-like protein [Seminavis robusta]|eukprot:Sro256_g100610.1 FR47-like protein (214) ;mRNA; r:31063-32142
MPPFSGCLCLLVLSISVFFQSESVLALDAHANRLYTGMVSIQAEMHIRDSTSPDLMPVSDMMVDAFYNNPSCVTKYHCRLAEYTRLQNSFPKREERHKHRMLVAALTGRQEVIGFCQLDSRPPPPSTFHRTNPRPMLSDLLVSPNVRRQGVGRRLVELCETIALKEFNSSVLYLKVLTSNEAAKAMYMNMGYRFIDNPGEPAEILLLEKHLMD